MPDAGEGSTTCQADIHLDTRFLRGVSPKTLIIYLPDTSDNFFWTRINTDFHGFFYYFDYYIATNLSVLFRVHPCTKLKLLVNNYTKLTDWSKISISRNPLLVNTSNWNTII